MLDGHFRNFRGQNDPESRNDVWKGNATKGNEFQELEIYFPRKVYFYLAFGFAPLGQSKASTCTHGAARTRGRNPNLPSLIYSDLPPRSHICGSPDDDNARDTFHVTLIVEPMVWKLITAPFHCYILL